LAKSFIRLYNFGLDGAFGNITEGGVGVVKSPILAAYPVHQASSLA
jgi:hypothetical protein